MPTLHFKGKSAVENYHHTVPHHVLEFDAKLSCLAKGQAPSLDGNLIIEGDNLLALKALLPTHAGKIKCVYIDPPYNTGNEGWVYNDNLTQPQFKEWIGNTVGKEGEDACRHDKWCCMMYPRLMLLRELLSENGSIWISIDDNEVQNLRALLDEIFGKQGCASPLWEKVYSPKSSAKYLSENHDYVVVYAKNKGGWNRRLLPRTEEANARFTRTPTTTIARSMEARATWPGTTAKGTYSIECPGGRVIDGPPESDTGPFRRTTSGNSIQTIVFGGAKTEMECLHSSDFSGSQDWFPRPSGHTRKWVTQDAKKEVR
ncbi:MAG: site-specific DNA-methyltransferase [Phycisphaerales bacterium]|nr:site-specific DNA-methyltransferase [Phycisphaerales bacterium]